MCILLFKRKSKKKSNVSNSETLYFKLLMSLVFITHAKFLCYFMLPSLRLDNSVHIIYNYSYHLQRFNISQKNIFYIPWQCRRLAKAWKKGKDICSRPQLNHQFKQHVAEGQLQTVFRHNCLFYFFCQQNFWACQTETEP